MKYDYEYLKNRLGDDSSIVVCEKDGTYYLIYPSPTRKDGIVVSRMGPKTSYTVVTPDNTFIEWGED